MQLPWTFLFCVGPARTVFPVVEFGFAPESVSVQLKVTVTGDCFVQVPAVYGVLFGPTVALPVTTGGVLSIMIGPKESPLGGFVALVATSEHAAVRVVPAVSAVRTTVVLANVGLF
jgi:hypothetical protein